MCGWPCDADENIIQVALIYSRSPADDADFRGLPGGIRRVASHFKTPLKDVVIRLQSHDMVLGHFFLYLRRLPFAGVPVRHLS